MAPPPPPAPTSADGPTGQHIDHFVLEERLGQGGMGAVYLAHDTSLERKVAIKVLPSHLAARGELRGRFVREARAQARLTSPHITQIFFIGEMPPDAHKRRSLYFAMELVVGGSLEDLLERGETLEPERARLLMLGVAAGLANAREHGIIHRDIKPSNLLLDSRGLIKIADFGLAKPVDDGGGDALKLTAAGVIVGSPHYMSPEQAMGDDAVDHRSDMYALGCTFYHLLTGQPPYDGNTPFAIVNQHVQSPVPDIRQAAPRVPSALAAVIARLMAKRPDERFTNYDELIDALEAAAPRQTIRGGFWARGAALLVDLVIASVAVGLLGWPGLLAHLAYVTVGHARFGQTLGKRLMHLRVRAVDGEPLTLPRSALRTVINLWLPLLIGIVVVVTEGTGQLVAQLDHLQPTELDALRTWLVAVAVSNGVLSLLYAGGLAMAAFHPRRQAIHDILAGSEVVYELNDPATAGASTSSGAASGLWTRGAIDAAGSTAASESDASRSAR